MPVQPPVPLRRRPRRTALAVSFAVLALAACGDDDDAADGASGRRRAEGATVDEALPALLVEQVHLLGQATMARVGQRADQLAAAEAALTQNAAAVAAAVSPGAPQLVERAWTAHLQSYGAYTAAVMGDDPAAEEGAVALVERSSDALLTAFEGAAPAAPAGSTTTTAATTTGGADQGGQGGADQGGQGGTDQGGTTGGGTQGGTTGGGTQGGTTGGGDDQVESGAGDQTDQGDAAADQGQADAGADLGDTNTAEQDTGAGEETVATGLAGILQSHQEGTLQAIDAVVAGDFDAAARLTAANAEETERLASALGGGGHRVDHGSLELVAEHAEHPIVAGAVTDALVHGRTAEHEAALVQAEANTVALLEQLRGVAGSRADTFEELWRQHLDAYQAYARGAAAQDAAATAAARPALAEYVDGVAELIDRWTDGGMASDEVASELRRHVDGTLQVIDAQVAGDHATAYRLTHEGVLHLAAFGARLSTALDEAAG